MTYERQLLKHIRKLEKKLKMKKGGGGDMKDLVLANAKFITALVAGGLIVALQHFGFVPTEEFTKAVGVVVTALLVWLVPNK